MLQYLDPTAVGAWNTLSFFNDGSIDEIDAFLSMETRRILPRKSFIFRALELTQPKDVKVIILGQDPYPTDGDADGLAFSYAGQKSMPRSLRNVFTELDSDLHQQRLNGDLKDWAKQGVLLLNTALTVPEGQSGCHCKIGWEALTEQIIKKVSSRPCAFILWGNKAKKFKQHINLNSNHLFVESAHPGRRRPPESKDFFGSRPFSTVNNWLSCHSMAPIVWA